MALAVGWAVILIPMALKRHDDEAMSRPVDTFSDSVRVVGASTAKRPATEVAPVAAPTAAAQRAAAPAPVSEVVPVPVPVPASPQLHRLTREAARSAARRRRRVLVVLLLALVAVGVSSYLAVTPWWSTAVPAALVVAFLVVARLTVRAQQVRRAAPDQPAAPTADSSVELVEPVVATPHTVEPDLGPEDTQGLSREQLAEAVAAPVLDEGGLWDPLPITLPTYVTKARARRTVRTIEITGMTSSGHDPADSELARTAEEAAKVEAESTAEAEVEERKAAGA